MKVNTNWDHYIEQGKIKEMLLGKDVELFMPEDGKSGIAHIDKYRWMHDRGFMLDRVFEYYDDAKLYNELSQVLEQAINELIEEDPLVALEVVAAITGGIFYSIPERSQVDYRRIYPPIHEFLKDQFSKLDDLPKKSFDIPSDYPAIFEKVKSSIVEYFNQLDKRYLLMKSMEINR